MGKEEWIMTWIAVEDRLPPIDSWALVVQDYNVGDWFDRQRRPLRQVFAAKLTGIDELGWSEWAKTGNRYDALYLVTHWQPYPTVEQPEENNDE
jgi:hypothetical protein